jgi:hypothetical protein
MTQAATTRALGPVLWDSDDTGASNFQGNCPLSAVLYLLWGSLGGQCERFRDTADLGSWVCAA